jgi:hypothetical protein
MPDIDVRWDFRWRVLRPDGWRARCHRSMGVWELPRRGGISIWAEGQRQSARTGSSHEMCEGRGSQSGRGNWGPAPQKHPAFTERRKSKTYANMGDIPPAAFQAVLSRRRLASLSFDRIRPAGDRQSNPTRAAICRRDGRNPSIESMDSEFPGESVDVLTGGAHSRRHKDALPTQPV